MYLLRPVKKTDIKDLKELAGFLDTVNFPNDSEKIEKGIENSIESFSQKPSSKGKEKPKGMYQFVIEDVEKKKVLGVSKIIAHHGTKKHPHFYWQISYDHRQSKTIGIGMTHQVLKLGKDTKGHSEIAGIIVHPEFQGKQLGKQLFYVRLLYLGLNRSRFLDRFISELLPPLDKNNRSVLWEAYGRKFTGLTYQEADQLSQDNKEFIDSLFPQNRIYTCILPIKARQVIGKVGAKSLPVQGMAEKNGFTFLNQIDPFDGGPHYGCKVNKIIALKNLVSGRAQFNKNDVGKSGIPGLVCKLNEQGLNFRSLSCHCKIDSISSKEKDIICSSKVLNLLQAKPDEMISFLPYT